MTINNNFNFNIDEIRKYIPHGYPFLLVDRIVELEPGQHCKGIKNVTFNEPFFTGHFDFYPVMPGVLQIEAMAQVAGCLNFLSKEDQTPNKEITFLVGVDKTKFKKQVRPGDQLVITARFIEKKSVLIKFGCEIHIRNLDNSLTFACSSEIKVVISEKSKLQ